MHALAFPEQRCVISGLLQLVFIWFLEQSGVPIIVTKGVLLKVLRPDLRARGRCALVLLQLVFSSIDSRPAVLSSADDSLWFRADDLPSRLCQKEI